MKRFNHALKIIVSSLVLITAIPLHADTPSNTELYEMIKSLQGKQANLENEAQEAKTEAKKAKAELARYKVAQSKVGLTAPIDPMTVKEHTFVNYDLTYLKASFNNDVAFTSEIGGNDNNMRTTEYDWNHDYGSRVEFGQISNTAPSWKATLFNYEANVTTSGGVVNSNDIEVNFFDDPDIAFTASSNGESVVADRSLEISSIDLELLHPMQYNSSQIILGYGIRHASINHEVDITEYSAGGAVNDSIHINNDFRGLGPTFSADLTRPIFANHFENNDWGLNFFTGAQFSYLFGSGDINLVDTGGDESLRFNRDGGMTTAEFQLGLELTYTPSEKTRFFARLAGESQYWENAGSISANAAEGTDDEDQSEELKNSDMALTGFSATIGVESKF